MKRLLSILFVLSLAAMADDFTFRIRMDNAQIEEVLIGCAAKAAGLTMVTHNVKHFCHIDGIEIEDWVASK